MKCDTIMTFNQECEKCERGSQPAACLSRRYSHSLKWLRSCVARLHSVLSCKVRQSCPWPYVLLLCAYSILRDWTEWVRKYINILNCAKWNRINSHCWLASKRGSQDAMKKAQLCLSWLVSAWPDGFRIGPKTIGNLTHPKGSVSISRLPWVWTRPSLSPHPLTHVLRFSSPATTCRSWTLVGSVPCGPLNKQPQFSDWTHTCVITRGQQLFWDPVEQIFGKCLELHLRIPYSMIICIKVLCLLNILLPNRFLETNIKHMLRIDVWSFPTERSKHIIPTIPVWFWTGTFAAYQSPFSFLSFPLVSFLFSASKYPSINI